MQSTVFRTGLARPRPLTGRERFAAACARRALERPPVWLMRQAGRYLPEYLATRAKAGSFMGLATNTEFATEVTLQPLDRYPIDAAILFSDILVIPEALGQPYHFRETGGVGLEFRLDSAADIDRLNVAAVVDKLHYVAAALQLLRAELGNHTALIGFTGSPWTLATFMLEGGSVPVYTRAQALLAADPRAFGRLMERLTAAVTAYLQMQIAAGVDALQIFDSHGGQLPPGLFMAASGRWMQDIITRLKPVNGQAVPPVIVFSLGAHGNWNDLAGLGASVLGLDAKVAIADVRRQLPATLGVQGNLDPAWLLHSPEEVATATRRLLEDLRGQPGHIFNLGHGVPPAARLESVAALVETVKSFK